VKTYLDCIPCFFRQALQAARLAGADEETQREILIKLGQELSLFSLESTPPEIGKSMYALIRERTGQDPFQKIKTRSNQYVLDLYPEMKRRLEDSSDPLRVAVRLAIAGNVIDYATGRKIKLRQEVEKVLATEYGIFQFAEFKKAIRSAGKILYLCDNAGEIVFDRILIEEIQKEFKCEITAAVRGKPVINDATLEDARQVGLDKVCRVISTGSDAPGILLGESSEEFLKMYQTSDLIISKGQGNFESLWGEKKKIFFLFRVKCAVVARHLGSEEGDIVLLSS
jgi:uncharacterized protein with ATP-grasp and redox domains